MPKGPSVVIPPTPKQLRLAARLGVFLDGLTKHEAAMFLQLQVAEKSRNRLAVLGLRPGHRVLMASFPALDQTDEPIIREWTVAEVLPNHRVRFVDGSSGWAVEIERVIWSG